MTHAAFLAQASARSAPASGAKLKPDWAGSEDLLSRVVNAAIATPGLYDVMKLLARQTLISTVRRSSGTALRICARCAALMRPRGAAQAEKNGIPWRDEVKRYEADPRYQARARCAAFPAPLGLSSVARAKTRQRRCKHKHTPQQRSNLSPCEV